MGDDGDKISCDSEAEFYYAIGELGCLLERNEHRLNFRNATNEGSLGRRKDDQTRVEVASTAQVRRVADCRKRCLYMPGGESSNCMFVLLGQNHEIQWEWLHG